MPSETQRRSDAPSLPSEPQQMESAMKLLELQPHWCLAARWDTPDGTQHFLNGDTTKRSGMGLSFLCPVHRDHRLVVMFSNPVDGLPPCAESKYRWQRSGESFDNLTLGPSIDVSGNRHGDEIKTPCWHGFIVNGEIR